MITHIVLFAWRPGVTAQQQEDMGVALLSLRETVPGILNISYGHQNSPEGLGKSFTTGFVVIFVDAAARDIYLPHPAHQRVVEKLLPLLEDVVVLDYQM